MTALTQQRVLTTSRLRPVDARQLWAGVGALALLGALLLPWLNTAMGRSSSAFEVPLVLPGWTWLAHLSYGSLLVAAMACLVLGALGSGSGALGRQPPGPSPRTWLRAGGLAAATAAVVFLLQAQVTDIALQQRLANDASDFTQFTRQLNYRVPQPSITHVLLIPLTTSQSLLASALRVGWYATAVAAVALLLASRHPKDQPRPSRSRRRALAGSLVAAVPLLVVASALLRAVVADRVTEDAARLADQGRYAQAAARYLDAIHLNPQLESDPRAMLGLGTVELQVGLGGQPPALYASALDYAAAGNGLQALALLSHATTADPNNPLYQHAEQAVAVQAALKHADPAPLQWAGLAGTGSPVVAFTLGRLEVRQGQLTGGIAALSRAAVAPSGYVRSAALTWIGLAQLQEGQPSLARTTMERAVAEDPLSVNVVARGFTTGLYATPPRS